jgi:hypothetical protein
MISKGQIFTLWLTEESFIGKLKSTVVITASEAFISKII